MGQGEGNFSPKDEDKEARGLMGTGAWPVPRPRLVHLTPPIRCHHPTPSIGRLPLAL